MFMRRTLSAIPALLLALTWTPVIQAGSGSHHGPGIAGERQQTIWNPDDARGGFHTLRLDQTSTQVSNGIKPIAYFTGKDLSPLPAEEADNYCSVGRFFIGNFHMHYTSGILLEGGNLVATAAHTFIKTQGGQGAPLTSTDNFVFRLGSHDRPINSRHSLAFVDYPMDYDRSIAGSRDIALACLAEPVPQDRCSGFKLPTRDVLERFYQEEEAPVTHVGFSKTATPGVEPGSIQMTDACVTRTVPSTVYTDLFPNDCTAVDGHSGGIMDYEHEGERYAMGIMTGGVYQVSRTVFRGVPRDDYDPDAHFSRAILMDDTLLENIQQAQQHCDAHHGR